MSKHIIGDGRGTLSITGRAPDQEEERQIDFRAWKLLLGNNAGLNFNEVCKEIGDHLGIDPEHVGAQLWDNPTFTVWHDVKDKVQLIRLRSTQPTVINHIRSRH